MSGPNASTQINSNSVNQRSAVSGDNENEGVTFDAIANEFVKSNRAAEFSKTNINIFLSSG